VPEALGGHRVGHGWRWTACRVSGPASTQVRYRLESIRATITLRAKLSTRHQVIAAMAALASAHGWSSATITLRAKLSTRHQVIAAMAANAPVSAAPLEHFLQE